MLALPRTQVGHVLLVCRFSRVKVRVHIFASGPTNTTQRSLLYGQPIVGVVANKGRGFSRTLLGKKKKTYCMQSREDQSPPTDLIMNLTKKVLTENYFKFDNSYTYRNNVSQWAVHSLPMYITWGNLRKTVYNENPFKLSTENA